MSAYDPGHDHLLLFDGICHLCDATVRFIVRHDPDEQIKFAPIQSPLGREHYIRHGLDPDHPTVFLLLTPQGAFKASDAVIEIGRILGGAWKLLTLLKPLPRPWRDALYLFIARNRYRWFGKKDACMLPTPELRGRLVAINDQSPSS